MTYFKNNEEFKGLTIENLKWRYISAASQDVVKTYQKLGWVCPLSFGNKKIRDLLRPVPLEKDDERISDEDWIKKFSEEGNAVFKSKRDNFEFYSNVPALINILLLWLCEMKSLVPHVQKTKKRCHLVDRLGNLRKKNELSYDSHGLWNMKVSYEAEGTKLSFSDAIVSLVTDGKGGEGGAWSDITFDNMLSDCGWTEDDLKKNLNSFAKKKDYKNFFKKLLVPTEKELEAAAKKAAEKAAKADQDPGEDAGSAANEEETAPLPDAGTEGDYYGVKGNFPFQKSEIKRITGGDEDISSLACTPTSLDPVISEHSEKLVRLMLARLVGRKMSEEGEEPTTFSDLLSHPLDDTKEGPRIAGGMSRDVIAVVAAMCHSVLETAAVGTPENDVYKNLTDVMNGVPIPVMRQRLGHFAKHVCGDRDSAKLLYIKKKIDVESLYESESDDEEEKRWKKNIRRSEKAKEEQLQAKNEAAMAKGKDPKKASIDKDDPQDEPTGDVPTATATAAAQKQGDSDIEMESDKSQTNNTQLDEESTSAAAAPGQGASDIEKESEKNQTNVSDKSKTNDTQLDEESTSAAAAMSQGASDIEKESEKNQTNVTEPSATAKKGDPGKDAKASEQQLTEVQQNEAKESAADPEEDDEPMDLLDDDEEVPEGEQKDDDDEEVPEGEQKDDENPKNENDDSDDSSDSGNVVLDQLKNNKRKSSDVGDDDKATSKKKRKSRASMMKVTEAAIAGEEPPGTPATRTRKKTQVAAEKPDGEREKEEAEKEEEKAKKKTKKKAKRGSRT
jgi:hypothetical protein